ncbi:hypothetical protein [Ferribacterium limneticum]|uniref:hypothetical protein n=1 Tax=Ferribacterium limneticum TaxID=76259 RepID=UPI001CF80C8C|nr:hypothetical protein [Ferribacterium limneticum]UCV26708.1 hypothetical protein KI617_10345 [Ferribacterium limneticum]UCV30625.1 hypothetical protein KI608_10345 [Ferribacterium limneticum]
MSTIGQRGKLAEKKVDEVLKRFNEMYLGVAYHRYPDARSARGSLKAQPADYLVASAPKAYHLEVKEMAHDFRLPKDKIAQLPLLKKFKLAGIDFGVIILHTETKLWRYVPASHFAGPVQPSWDCSEFPTYATAEEALRATGWFG